MIYVCPYCGRKVNRAVENGITTCNNCNRIFDSSEENKILSAAWLARRDHLVDVESIKYTYALTEDQAFLIKHYIIDNGLSHDEFLKLLKPVKNES